MAAIVSARHSVTGVRTSIQLVSSALKMVSTCDLSG